MTHFNKFMDCRGGIRRLAMTENDRMTRKLDDISTVTKNDCATRKMIGISTMTMGFDFKL